MTEQEQLHVRAELAQSMGWKIIEVEERYCDPTWELIIGNSEIVNLPAN